MNCVWEPPGHGQVIDIGGSAMSDQVGASLRRALKDIDKPGKVSTLPDELLYDDVGLGIWNKIIFTKEFYQTHEEMALLVTHGKEIVDRVEPGVTIIDLGAGDMRKVQCLLNAFEEVRKPATYLALDISKRSLEDNIGELVKSHPASSSSISCAGLWGTFENGAEYVKRISGPILLASLGSVICNDAFVKALDHLKVWARLMRRGDRMLIGMDGHLLPKDKDKIWKAYHSSEDLFRDFFNNGFSHANKLLHETCFREEDWSYEAELEEEPTTRHRFFFRAKRDVRISSMGVTIAKGRELDWFDSHKQGLDNVQAMCSKAGLSVIDVWKPAESNFRQYLVKAKDLKDPKEDADSGVSGLS